MLPFQCKFKLKPGFFVSVKWTDPFLIIGPVIFGCGLLILLFSVEICIRLYKSNQKVLDPEIDNLTNLHQIKHWVNPGMIFIIRQT